MATLRATQFASGIISGTSAIDIYTVPSGHKAILKSLTVQEVSGSNTVVNVRLSAFGTWFGQALVAYPDDNSHRDLRLWVVLEPGQVLQLQRINAGQVTYTASGSLMTI